MTASTPERDPSSLAYEPHRQEYDPYRFLDDVEGLLSHHGLKPAHDEGHRHAQLLAACALLRSFEVEPQLRGAGRLDLDGSADYNRRVHGD
ncbi:MAG TPA: hypothetical protein VHX38_15150 [Pseudonocardiaceae bacterium]|jgi:hypothetical protein|nr:hypothetical protein [Pseudonocardiaceae bacterium]